MLASLVSSEQPLPLGTPLSFNYASGIYKGYLSLELRFPGMTAPTPFLTKANYTYAFDAANQRWASFIPAIGSQQYSLASGRFINNGENCFQTGTGFVQELVFGQSSVVKVDQGRGRTDIYFGGSQTSDIGFSLAAKTFVINRRSLELLSLDFLQKSGANRNPDGSCTPSFEQIYGKVDFDDFTKVQNLPATGPGSMDSFFVLPSQCTPNVPDWNAIRCFD